MQEAGTELKRCELFVYKCGDWLQWNATGRSKAFGKTASAFGFRSNELFVVECRTQKSLLRVVLNKKSRMNSIDFGDDNKNNRLLWKRRYQGQQREQHRKDTLTRSVFCRIMTLATAKDHLIRPDVCPVSRYAKILVEKRKSEWQARLFAPLSLIPRKS